jgi:hypothetical protein
MELAVLQKFVALGREFVYKTQFDVRRLLKNVLSRSA